MMGAGGISASAEDLARYVVAVQTRDLRIVPADADRLFQARPFQGSLGYAYGWIVYQGPDGELVSHEGASRGFSSLAAIDTEQMLRERRHFPRMDGKLIFKHALRRLPEAT